MASPSASDRPDNDSNSLSTSSGTVAVGGTGTGRGSETTAEGLTPVKASDLLIQRFGGIRPMANKLEVPFTTVQGWKKRGAIPAARLNDLRTAAQRHGIKLEEAELEAVARFEDRHPEGHRSTVPPSHASELIPEPPTLAASAPVDDLSVELPAVPAAPEPTLPFEVAPSELVSSEVAPSEVKVGSNPTPVPTPVPTPESTPIPVSIPAAPSESAPTPEPKPLSRSVPVSGPPGSGSKAAPVTAAPITVDAMPVLRPGPAPGNRLASPLAAAVGRLLASGPAQVSLAGAVIALIAAAVAIIGSSSPPASGPSSATDGRLNTLESTISRVALQQGSQTAAIEKQISTLDARLALAASQQSADALASRLAILEQDLPALQRQVSGQGLGSPALADLLAATQLRNQLEAANPFVVELAAFRLTAFNDPPLKQALDQIANRGRTGIPTEAWLVGRFSTVATNIVRVAAWDHPGQRIADFFLDVLSDWAPPLYRLTGVPEGSTPRAITERAEAWMATGDFSRAVEQLGELTDKPAETAVAWLAEARARVIADHARELLGKHMLALAEPDMTRP